MSPAGRLLAAAAAALALVGCQTQPPSPAPAEDRTLGDSFTPGGTESVAPPISSESDTLGGDDAPSEPPQAEPSSPAEPAEPRPREVAIVTEVSFGLAFFAPPPPEETRLGPLVVAVDVQSALRTPVSVRNEGSEPVSGIVITDAVRVSVPPSSDAPQTEAASAGEDAAEPALEITGTVSQGTCTRDSVPNATMFRCDVGTIDPGATATLTVTVSHADGGLDGRVVHDVRVAAILP
ncbi:MAG: hypothetical protein ACRD0K_19180 [Egibacteraceae bacterium]